MSRAETVAILPMLIALVSAVLALAADAWVSKRLAIVLSAVGLIGAGVVSAIAAGSDSQVVLGFLVTGSGFSALAAVILMASGFALLGGAGELGAHAKGGQIAALATLVAGAGAGVATSMDLVATLILLEVGALAAYAVVASGRRTGSAEAAAKYFVQGSIATAAFVLGIGAVLGVYGGSAGLERILAVGELIDATPALVGLGLISSALALKAGAFPFHSWVPDAYEMAPSTGAAILASGAKIGAIAGLMTVGLALNGPLAGSRAPIAAIAAGSIVYGNLVALRQRSYARMLAYSGIAQAGYALVPVAVGQPQQAAFFLATYAVGVVGAFLAAYAVARVRPEWDGSIEGMAGLGRTSPWLASGIAVLVLSLTGVPPLLGFWGKLQAFGIAIYAALGGRNVTWALLALVGLVGSVVSFGYYGRVLRAMYFEEERAGDEAGDTEGPAETVGGGSRRESDGGALPKVSEDEVQPSSGIAGRVVGVCAIAAVLGGAVILLMGQGSVVAWFAYR